MVNPRCCKVRNTNIEIFRFVLMVAIFIGHTIVLGLDFVDGQVGMYEYYRWLLLAANAGSSFIGLLFIYVLARYMAMNNLS